ncbi:MAG: long-chain fatty acid--CoA ligase [Haloarculaceae archaeon]
MSDPGDPPWLRAEREVGEGVDRETVPELFERTAERHADRVAQRYKGGVYDRSLAGALSPAPDGEYAALTYADLRGIVRRLAAGFGELGLAAGDRVAIFANTRMEWAQCDLAALAAGCVVTTVYTESSREQVRYLLADPGVSVAVVENERLLERVLAVEDDLDLSDIVLLDEPATDHGRADVHTLGEIFDRGAAAFDRETYDGWLDAREPEELASIIYTSGTTGDPKGVRLTHWNFGSNIRQCLRRFGPRPDRGPGAVAITPETTTLSFLPLAHVFERLVGHFLILGSGATVAYAESPDTISEDVRAVRPEVMTSVPRVYERVFDAMREGAGESGPKRRIFEWALDVADSFQRADSPGPLLRAKHAVADRLVYSTVAENLGGNVDFMISGGGSLDPDLCRLFNGMGLTVIEGYGLTETAPVVCANPPEDVRPGTMGPPLVGVEVCLDESRVTDGFAGDGAVGELLVCGENVTDGYWNDPEATEAAFVEAPASAKSSAGGDASGRWFRTGDIVEQTADGYLVFRERLKQVLVLSTGKNLAPGPIEDRFATSDRVEQVMVVGEDRKFVGALIVPDWERLHAWATQNGLSLPDTRAQLRADDRVREWVGEAVDAVNEELGDVERIKEFELVAEEWTADNDMLTPSMKKKRRSIRAAHDDAIERIYERAG